MSILSCPYISNAHRGAPSLLLVLLFHWWELGSFIWFTFEPLDDWFWGQQRQIVHKEGALASFPAVFETPAKSKSIHWKCNKIATAFCGIICKANCALPKWTNNRRWQRRTHRIIPMTKIFRRKQGERQVRFLVRFHSSLFFPPPLCWTLDFLWEILFLSTISQPQPQQQQPTAMWRIQKSVPYLFARRQQQITRPCYSVSRHG